MAVRLERRRREVVDTPVELLVSYTNQSIFVARRAVRIRVIVYVLEDLDGVAQIVTIRIIAIEVILPEADCIIKIDFRHLHQDIGRRDRLRSFLDNGACRPDMAPAIGTGRNATNVPFTISASASTHEAFSRARVDDVHTNIAPMSFHIGRARLDRLRDGLLVFFVGVIFFRVAAAVYFLTHLLVAAAPVVLLASGTAISGPASHASWRVVGQWGGASGTSPE